MVKMVSGISHEQNLHMVRRAIEIGSEAYKKMVCTIMAGHFYSRTVGGWLFFAAGVNTCLECLGCDLRGMYV
ncbi:hypothetical protein [Psychromonas antarctica]|uniref:hypothetical protein n=1 Tax=Psychromonas antarctica TaxID=67573 RepID=UPI001EE82046|nr:hypothetical protein [Psychromonas antarctica]MCG6201806.1 hypothetical protein [Psychromonas antarctica]